MNLQDAKFIEVQAGVRYWEDAYINGQEDTDGNIPLRHGDLWLPIIELSTGEVIDWPQGMEAKVHYKVCDAGEYWLLDENKKRIAKYDDYYVPNSVLCVGDNGYGDYIIFTIGTDGKIVNWKKPAFDENWKEIS